MTPHPSVLLSLRDAALRDELDGWVRGYGYQTCLTADAEETMSWLSRERFSASFLESEMERSEGEAVWRLVRPDMARRVVLMSRDRNRDLWFEALRHGVATVLPLPPVEAMVRAALTAVSGSPPPGTTHTF